MEQTSPRPSYFTCTLSDALSYNQIHHQVRLTKTAQGAIVQHQEFGNINEFVDFLATNYGDHLAVGCVTPAKAPKVNGAQDSDHISSPLNESTNSEMLNFREVQRISSHVARRVRSILDQTVDPETEKRCVALIASSSVVFMCTWLGLLRAGYEVLLVAPQSTRHAIRHLLKASQGFAIVFDGEHEDLVSGTLAPITSDEELQSVQSLKMQWESLESLKQDSRDVEIFHPPSDNSGVAKESTAFYFHSSGTTGMPKLIPQTHNSAVAVLPKLQRLPFSTRIATFSTTPLYSGGIADLFRAWSAASPLWIFPEGRAPIIASTVQDCFCTIDQLSQSSTGEHDTAWKLGYLSCVPYVLESIVEMAELKKRLREMDAVGVGGAAMPKALGDRLVQEGLRLVSRFGSSECGFLLSSQRDYDTDKNWNVLRGPETDGLEFAKLEDGRYELIVTDQWPLVSSAMHAKRPFNTHDVFLPHESIPGGWTYIGRSDAQITLKTGKKFDPTAIEDALRAHESIQDVIVLGDDRLFAAALILTLPEHHGVDEARSWLWKLIQEVNLVNPLHARIGERCFIVLNGEQRKRVRRNNKGGVVRSAIDSDFEVELNSIYGSSSNENNAEKKLSQSYEDVLFKIRSIVHCTLAQACNTLDSTDLFDAGLDSPSSIQIRKRICDVLPANLRSRVPINVVYECGTIEVLVRFITELLMNQDGRRSSAEFENQKREKRQEMLDMVDKYVSLQPSMLDQVQRYSNRGTNAESTQRTSVVLTGSTGFLGIHILKCLLQDTSVSQVFLCVRDSRLMPYEEAVERARARVHSTLSHHGLLKAVQGRILEKVEYVPFLLSESCLGIPRELYHRMVCSITHVIHSAWEVNFNLPLKTFGSQIKGTVNLFNLLLLSSRSSNCKLFMLFCSSVASVSNMPWAAGTKPVSLDPAHAAELGYGQSKWVAESVLSTLAQQTPELSVSVLRVGQLSGDTATGIWNRREAWPLMMDASLRVLGKDSNKPIIHIGSRKPTEKTIVLPDLESAKLEALDWLPVDVAARHIRRLITAVQPGVSVEQVCNDGSSGVMWKQAQAWIVAWADSRGLRSKVVPPKEWLLGLENSPVEHQAKALIGLWRENWLAGAATAEEIVTEHGSMSHEHGGSNMSEVLNRKYFWRILDWILQGSE